MAPRPGCLSRVKKGNVQRKHADAAECCWGNKNKAEAQDEQRRLCTSRIRTVALRGQTYAKSSTQYLHTNVKITENTRPTHMQTTALHSK